MRYCECPVRRVAEGFEIRSYPNASRRRDEILRVLASLAEDIASVIFEWSLSTGGDATAYPLIIDGMVHLVRCDGRPE